MFTLFKRAVAKAMRKARAANVRAATAAVKKLVAASVKPPRKKRAAAKPAKPGKPKAAARARPREGLGAAIGRITAAAGPKVAAPVARGASFETLQHRSKHGARAYRLYVPARLNAAPQPAPQPALQPAALAPLVVMLHGCTQTPEAFAVGTRMNALADELGFLVAYPEQPASANPNRCWNWFSRADQARGAGEPALIAGIARAVLRARATDPARVYVAGLSAGGAAAMLAAAAYPDVFAAVGVHSGLPVGAAYSPAQAMLAMRRGSIGAEHGVAMPTIVFHGDADRVVHPRNGRVVAMRSAAATPGLAASQIKGRSASGRAFTRTLYSAADGRPVCEHWSVEGAGHAWAGGDAAAGYADPAGPDASREMLRFFLDHRISRAGRARAAATAAR